MRYKELSSSRAELRTKDNKNVKYSLMSSFAQRTMVNI